MKLKFTRRLWLGLISFVGFLVSMGIPAAFVVSAIYRGVDIHTADTTKMTFSFVGAGLMVILALIYIKWIKKVFDRKLQAVAVANEIGMISTKPVIWNRLLKTIEYVYPAIITLLLLLGMKTAFTTQPIFNQLYMINIWFVVLLGAGSIIFLVGDFLKVRFMNEQQVEDALASEMSKDKLMLERLKQNNKAELEALRIKRQIEKLKDDQ